MLSGAHGRMMGTERLLLRRLAPGDAPFVLRLLNEPSVLRFIGDREVRTLEDAEAYIGAGPQAGGGEPGMGLRLVTSRSTGTPLGLCGLMRKPWLDGPDLAYAFVPEAEGRGYATEAARAVLDSGLHEAGLERVQAVVIPENVGSIRVLEKLGFRREGTVADPSTGTELALYANTPAE